MNIERRESLVRQREIKLKEARERFENTTSRRAAKTRDDRAEIEIFYSNIEKIEAEAQTRIDEKNLTLRRREVACERREATCFRRELECQNQEIGNKAKAQKLALALSGINKTRDRIADEAEKAKAVAERKFAEREAILSSRAVEYTRRTAGLEQQESDNRRLQKVARKEYRRARAMFMLLNSVRPGKRLKPDFSNG